MHSSGQNNHAAGSFYSVKLICAAPRGEQCFLSADARREL
jgi:hypothetical protein